jgi:hypothetical protein
MNLSKNGNYRCARRKSGRESLLPLTASNIVSGLARRVHYPIDDNGNGSWTSADLPASQNFSDCDS